MCYLFVILLWLFLIFFLNADATEWESVCDSKLSNKYYQGKQQFSIPSYLYF